MDDVIRISMVGGLNNKLIRLENTVGFAVENNLRIIEPKFGWYDTTEEEKFSNLFDLNFFNENIEDKCGVSDILIPRSEYLGNEEKYKIVKHIKCVAGGRPRADDPFWESSTIELKTNVMGSLRPSSKIENIIQKNSCDQLVAVQLRIEKDWKQWTRRNRRLVRDNNEHVLISQEEFIEMFKNSELFSENIFFTTGVKQTDIQEKFESFDIDSRFFYDDSLGFETNATINFFLCIGAKSFIGMTRSTFSQNIFFCRYLNGDCNSYFYNYGNQLHKKDCNVHSLSFNDLQAKRFLEK